MDMGKIIVIAICAGLFFLGGRAKEWLWYGDKKIFRRAGMPVVLGLYMAITLQWWLFFVIGGALQLMGLGYGSISSDDPKPSLLARLLNDHDGWLTRGVWGAIVSLGVSVWLLAFGWLNLWAFGAYIGFNFAIGYVLCRFRMMAWIIELAVGAGLAAIILLV